MISRAATMFGVFAADSELVIWYFDYLAVAVFGVVGTGSSVSALRGLSLYVPGFLRDFHKNNYWWSMPYEY